MKYDLVIAGGGTSGVSAAYIASKLGIKTLLIEKSDVLGGAITQGLVIPVMKLNSDNLNVDFYNDLISFAKDFSAQTTYSDGNSGWFNYELLKIVFDKMLSSVNCNVLFSTYPVLCSLSFTDKNFHLKLKHKLLSLHIETNYIIDATSNGEIFKLLKCNFQNSGKKFQAPSMRFTMSGINIKKFSNWILKTDKDRNITTSSVIDGEVHLSTAYTWDTSRKWALEPLFKQAVDDKVLQADDCAYFQIFTIPKMPGSINFNCPRILFNDPAANILDPFIYSQALIQGRERIYRLSEFCKKYLPGFENAYISHISDMLGVRESYRIKGKHTLSVNEIISAKKVKNPAFVSDYPIDIHSSNMKTDKLKKVKQKYSVPLNCLISEDYDNLYAVGRIISADFEAQAAVRTQLNCFSMGEAAAKDIYKKLFSV